MLPTPVRDDVLTVVPVDKIPFVLPANDLAIPTVLPVHDEVPLEVIPVRPGLLGSIGRAWRSICSVSEWLFGALALIVGLSILAATPILQFLSLGYLLEVSGRIARTGSLRDAFVGVRIAARAGSIVLGSWLMLLPLRLNASLAHSARIIDPDGPVARGWTVALIVFTVLLAAHIIIACSRGGKLRYFLWPFGNPIWLVRRLWRGGYYAEARDAVWEFVISLRLPYYFWLGVRGFAGAMAWLFLPITLLALGSRVPVLDLPGTVLLWLVLLYVPFLQVHFAAEKRFRAFFEVRAVRAQFERAPWAFAVAFFLTLLFALPLYLLKIEMVPREAAWLPSLVFILFMVPARLLTGWAVGRGRHRSEPRHWFFRWTGRFSMLPIGAFYVLIVFFTQYISWHGVWSLYEQHAFLLPVPFFSI
jgi:hypothetical protein